MVVKAAVGYRSAMILRVFFLSVPNYDIIPSLSSKDFSALLSLGHVKDRSLLKVLLKCSTSTTVRLSCLASLETSWYGFMCLLVTR